MLNIQRMAMLWSQHYPLNQSLPLTKIELVSGKFTHEVGVGNRFEYLLSVIFVNQQVYLNT